jgi:hypothetical protein
MALSEEYFHGNSNDEVLVEILQRNSAHRVQCSNDRQHLHSALYRVMSIERANSFDPSMDLCCPH